MGCSGTTFHLVELLDVWPRYLNRTLKLPRQGLVETLRHAAAGDALTFHGPDGLLVVALTPGADALELQVLLAVSTGAPGAFKRQEAAVCAIARDLGASSVVFLPARRGWDRMLGPGWITRGAARVRRLHEQGQGNPGNAAAGGPGREGAAAAR